MATGASSQTWRCSKVFINCGTCVLAIFRALGRSTLRVPLYRDRRSERTIIVGFPPTFVAIQSETGEALSASPRTGITVESVVSNHGRSDTRRQSQLDTTVGRTDNYCEGANERRATAGRDLISSDSHSAAPHGPSLKRVALGTKRCMTGSGSDRATRHIDNSITCHLVPIHLTTAGQEVYVQHVQQSSGWPRRTHLTDGLTNGLIEAPTGHVAWTLVVIDKNLGFYFPLIILYVVRSRQ